ncbi:glutaredoxin family protein [Methylophaga sp. OBS1]|jgi:thiol-disulfide isomerase/thioredoxin|uniref:glutaredoxin family protein n=1 Tax=Methylophaga sp. OBS1 TaxID=2991933 RepID=UPI00225760EF|nr:glutaredoxin family protein [Methylophaga sp. OBS1]MCX4193480.1 glutaredoxin family protein [Methylophaga sp. OBS1]
MQIILFTTEGCHLCEQAHELLLNIADKAPLDIILREIGDDDDLVARYGIRIPVVQFADQQELDWPFKQSDLEAIILR